MGDTCCTAAQLALIGITPEDILYAFKWGFGAVVLCWSWGMAVAAAVDVIRKV